MQRYKESLTYIAWGVASAAVFGSLYFSDIRNFPPCVLCWYQRIFMYPLVFIIGAGIFRKDTKFYQYVLPLSIVGLGISIYHNLLYYKILQESIAPCVNGVSCTAKYVEYFGFITIPFLSMCAFITITVLMLIYRKLSLKNNS
jgi:disulfide bond formation protein DsbB